MLCVWPLYFRDSRQSRRLNERLLGSGNMRTRKVTRLWMLRYQKRNGSAFCVRVRQGRRGREKNVRGLFSSVTFFFVITCLVRRNNEEDDLCRKVREKSASMLYLGLQLFCNTLLHAELKAEFCHVHFFVFVIIFWLICGSDGRNMFTALLHRIEDCGL